MKKKASIKSMEARLEKLVNQLERTPTNVDASAIIRRMGRLNVAIADAKRRKSNPSNHSYISRPSQITKRAPSRRLKKRRTKNIARPVKGRFPNPAPLLFIITAQKGSGKKMHFDGKNFSERARVSTFSTMHSAEIKAQSLLKQYPMLRSYRVTIEPNRIQKNFR